MLIGLSLSSCVMDIVRGLIPYEDVARVISAADPATPIDEHIAHNRRNAWYDNPDEAEAIARRLISENKLLMPGHENLGYPSDTREGHWEKDGVLVDIYKT